MATEYVVQGNYGRGWEDVTFEESKADAKSMLRCYAENEPQYPHRWIARRKEADES